RLLVALVDVGMVLARQLADGALDVLLGRVPRHAQDLVVVLVLHHPEPIGVDRPSRIHDAARVYTAEVELQGASALVTGAGRGIGRAIATTLARAGAAVTAVSRTQSELDSLVHEIRPAGGRALAHAADLQDP